MQRVVCVGSISQDIFFPTDEGVILKTPEDITAQVKVAFELGGKFRAQDRFESVGGVAANVAVGLARLGIPVQCYSQLGRDLLGTTLKTSLEQEGVGTELLSLAEGVKTDLSAIIVITQTGDRIIFHNRDANEQLRLQPEGLRRGDWLYVSSLNGSWRENIALIREAAHDGQHIALNPGQHNLKDDPHFMMEFLREVNVLFLNKDEAIEILIGNDIETSPERLNDEQVLVRALHGVGPSVVVLTDGKRGAWATDGASIWHAKSYEPHGLVDTTGGGDAFGSGFFAAHLQGLSLERCLRYGICNAGSVVGYYGAIQGLLDQETMTNLVENVVSEQLA